MIAIVKLELMGASWQEKGKGLNINKLCNSLIWKGASIVLNHFANLVICHMALSHHSLL